MRRPALILFVVLASLGLILAGCRSDLPARFSRLSQPPDGRAGGDPAPAGYGPGLNASFAADFAWCEGMTATLTVSDYRLDDSGSCTISADMGGGTTENVPAGTPATSPFERLFTLGEPGAYVYTVIATDAQGQVSSTSGTYWIDDEYRPLKLIAWYNRPTRVLSIEVGQYDGVDTVVEIEDLPEWVQSPDGAVHQIPGGNAELELTLGLLPHEENRCTVVVSATDADDNSEAKSVDILRPLFIYAAYYAPGAGEIRLGVSADFGQMVVVDLAPPEGVTVDGELSQTKDGGGEYAFAVSWDEETFAGGDAGLEVSDQFGNTASATVPLYTAPDSYEPDTLYAFPLQSAAAIGEPVRIVVATGVPANPFQYMNGARVIFDGGEPSYVAGSFNVGAPGGELKEADGIWTAVEPDSFLLADDWMIEAGLEYDQQTGTSIFDFNVTPLGGHATSDAGGELFNFEVEFAQPGLVTLGFQELETVKRTYYSDDTSWEYYWGDISNDHPGALNTVYVE